MGLINLLQTKTFMKFLGGAVYFSTNTLKKGKLMIEELEEQSQRSNREVKRENKKIIDELNRSLSASESELANLFAIRDIFIKKGYLKTEEEFLFFTRFLMDFYKHSLKFSHKKAFDKYLEFIPRTLRIVVGKSKDKNVDTKFLQSFDSNGNLIQETSIEFYNYIRSDLEDHVMKRTKYTMKKVDDSTNIEEFLNLIIPVEYRELERIQREKQLAREKEIRIREKAKLAAAKVETSKELVVEVKVKEKKTPLTSEEKIIKLYEAGKISQYFDNMEELERVLKPVISKTEWKECVVYEYNFIKNKVRVESIIGKESLKRILRAIDLEEFKRVLSNNFDDKSDDEIISIINGITDIPVKPRSHVRSK